MSTPFWLSIYADKVIEAGLLAALILAPLFFNPYDARIFELSKGALIRTLVLVMLAAWLVRYVESYPPQVGGVVSSAGRPRPKRFLIRLRASCAMWFSRNPVALPTLFIIAAYSISTLASVSPTQSVLGSYERSQGLYTTLSYIVIFFLAVNTLRSILQIERVISVALVASFPVVFYGIIQHYRLAPLDWSYADLSRLGSLTSTIGNPIFVGAYLVMIIPLTVGRLLGQANQAACSISTRPARVLLYNGLVFSFLMPAAAWILTAEFNPWSSSVSGGTPLLTSQELSAVQENFHCALGVTLIVIAGWWVVGWLKRDGSTFLLMGLYPPLLALQVACLIFTQKRGPFLGLLGGLWVFAMLYALIRGARRTALAVIGFGAISLILLAMVNLWSPFKHWLRTPYVGRLAHVLDLEEHTTKVRVLIWEGALNLALPHAPLWSPTDGEDKLNLLRPLIGYGPETLRVTYHRVYPPALALLEGPTALPDRAHNETLDVLVTTGLFGVAAYLIFFSSLFLFGLQQLGFIRTVWQHRAFLALWLGTGVTTALGAGMTLGWSFVGLALPAGMIVGLFLYFMGFILLRVQWTPPSSQRAVLLVTLIAALLGHFIEAQFGIPVTSTCVYFWLFAAALIVVGTQPSPEPETMHPAEQHIKIRGSTAPLLFFALLASLTFLALAFGFVSIKRLIGDASEGVRAIDVVMTSLTSKATSDGSRSSLAMLWLFFGDFFLALAFGLTHWGRHGSRGWGECLFKIAAFMAITFLIFFAYVFAQTFLLTRHDSSPLDGLVSTFPVFIWFLIGIVLLTAGALTWEYSLPRTRIARWWSSVVTPVVAIIAAGLIIKTNVSSVQADIIYRQAPRLAGSSTLEKQVQLFQQALTMQLPQDYAFAFLGDAYLSYAGALVETKQRNEVLTQSEEALQDARALNPLDPEHTLRLADLHLMWAGFAPSHTSKEDHLRASLDYYAQAMRLSPHILATGPFSKRYARALHEYSASLAKSQATPSVPSGQQSENP